MIGLGSALAAIQIALWRKTGFEHAMAPGEANAWIKLLFLAVLIAVSLGNADQLAAGISGVHAMHLGSKLVAMAVFYIILAHLLRVRQGEGVLEDERDREIEKQASGWGRGALIFCVIGLAVLLAFSPAYKLEWATHFMIANLLVFALMWGWLCEYAATVIYYWRDRQ